MHGRRYPSRAPWGVGSMLAAVVSCAGTSTGPPARPSPPRSSAGLHLAAIHRITASPGERHVPSVVAVATGYLVFWDEARDLHAGATLDDNFRILEARFGPDWEPLAPAATAVGKWGNQFGPAAGAADNTGYLAYYFADRSLRTGARDIELLPLAGFANASRPPIRVTRGDFGPLPPINHSSPTFVTIPGRNQIVVVDSWGYYHADRPAPDAYDDKDIEARVLDREGRLVRRLDLTGSSERGWEITPSLIRWDGPHGARFLLAYASKVGESSTNTPVYNVVLKEFDSDWGELDRRQVSFAEGGVTSPSLVVVSGTVYLSWAENSTQDVRVARLGPDLGLGEVMSLRQELLLGGFPRLGRPYAALSHAALFEARGRLGLAFVATMDLDVAANRVEEDVFTATFR